MKVLRASDRGQTVTSWLDSKHSFSFGQYYDANNKGFKTLRVINEDIVQPGGGFPTHFHRDMEILTHVIKGSLAHKDSMGNHSIIKEGEFQKMTAGSGIEHSEFNASEKEPCHFYQIWIFPKERSLEPNYQQKEFPEQNYQNKFMPVLSPDGKDGSMLLNQEAHVFFGSFEKDKKIDIPDLAKEGSLYLQVVNGSIITAQSTELASGDGVSIESSSNLSLKALDNSNLILFSL